MKNAAIPGAVLLMLGSIIFPLPPELLSVLLTLNFVAAVILLASALCISEPIKLSALPGMLLVLTLFRLALNVSTTRLILSEASAGSVVEAFGSVVIQGRLGVGIVVFLVLTLVQFLVIAKGAERVAEVSARFTLDALPGKQMAIDADLRSGIIDSGAARKRRDELQTESRFYGALDGAMKFVKGDAAAGLMITVVNFIGGIAAGVLGRGLDLQTALQLYSNMTIGDGLVCQIPSLMNAVSAGLVVTRVRKDESASLAADLWEQLSGGRGARFVAAAFSLLAGVAPGFPSGIFLSIGVVLLLMAFCSPRASKEAQTRTIEFTPGPPPLMQIRTAEDMPEDRVRAALPLIRNRFFAETGILIPEIDLQKSSGPAQLRIRGELLAQFESAISPENLIERCLGALRDSTAELVDDQMTQRLLDLYDQAFPEVITTVIPNSASVTQLTSILRELAGEGISIRQLDIILQVIAERAAKSPDDRVLIEEIRLGLKRTISAKFASADNTIEAFRVPDELDAHFAGAERGRHPLDPAKAALAAKLASEMPKSSVFVASRAARRLFSECLSASGFDSGVMAYDEAACPFSFKLLEPEPALRRAA